MRRPDKKGQMESQIFIYIMVLVIGAGILIYGYNAVKNIRSQADSVLFLQFENNIKNDLNTLTFDSSKVKSYDLPSSIKQLCFKSNSANNIDVTCEEGRTKMDYPLIAAAVNNNVAENVFLYPNGDKSFVAGVDIQLGDGDRGPEDKGCSPGTINFRCFDVKGSSLTLRMTGKGNYVLITSVS